MNNITQFLDLEDEDIVILSVSISGTVKTLTIESALRSHFCPLCQYKMHSRGIKKRKIQHPVLQDGYQVILLLHQRRWKCINKECGYESNDQFRFVSKNRRFTNSADMMIVQSFRDFSVSAASIAEKFHTSDTNVMDVFDRYVHMARLPLSEIISVDEVQIDLDEHCKYGLVIQDFYTGDPIDLLPSRRSNVTEPYFAAIPAEERAKVKYLISDMYNPYIGFANKYFPNAASVVDAFHVIQWMIHSIDLYLRDLNKRFKARDKENYLKEHPETSVDKARIPESDEVYLLKHYRFLILSNKSNIRYRSEPRMDRHFHALMNTYDYEDALFRINPRLRVLSEYKEKYIRFNTVNAGNPEQARKELDKLIDFYKDCGDSIFMDLACTLERHKEYIINSFVVVKKYGNGEMYDARLSNGAIESINRSVKDIRRNGRGYSNFDHFRNRFLYGTRKNPVIDATGKSDHVSFYLTPDNE